MSAVRRTAEDYLRMRRALGYKLEVQGWMLRGFVDRFEQVGATTVTIEHAVGWATQPVDADPSYWSDRLSVARQFARHLQTIDPACEVPPTRLLPCRRRRAIPYLYTPQEIAALMQAAGRLARPLQAATYQTLIGLMAVTGMRVGEVIALDRDDVDARHELLRIIDSKFGKSREIALHSSAMDALDAYGQRRDKLCPQPSCGAFFVSTAGARVSGRAFTACSSFLHYCAPRHPEHAALIQRVLAIPRKRADRRTVTFLAPEEVNALLDCPDRQTWAGRRDHALLLAAVQTGLRVSELLGLMRADVQLGTGAHLHAIGKGRKERVAPLTRQTVAAQRCTQSASPCTCSATPPR